MSTPMNDHIIFTCPESMVSPALEQSRLFLRDLRGHGTPRVIIRYTVHPRAHGVAAHVRRVERQLLRERTIYQLSTLLAKATGWVFLSSA